MSVTTEIAVQSEADLIAVLQSSLYPGAKADSVRMVLDYCRAAKLDPIQKPVHIVPMSVKVGDSYQMRDVIMPGIGLYRTQAARSGEMLGISEPEFGPDKVLRVGDIETTYPEWCRVSVKRLVQGQVATFTAVEYWIENYATAKRDSQLPNTMWRKRPRGQLAKCASAQALRMGFPEIGASPTAEEMEGKSFGDESAIEVVATERKPVELPLYPQERLDAHLPKWAGKDAKEIIATLRSKYTLSVDQVKTIEDTLRPAQSGSQDDVLSMKVADWAAALQEDAGRAEDAKAWLENNEHKLSLEQQTIIAAAIYEAGSAVK